MALRSRRTARAAMACLVPVLVAAGAATASAATEPPRPGGGAPDMALVVTGHAGRTRVLHSGEKDFARLRRLLRPDRTDTEKVPKAWAQGRYPTVRVTVVWGLTSAGGQRPTARRSAGGEVALERQDQLFVAADGIPWVRSDPAPNVVDDGIRWHRAPIKEFRKAERAGLLGPAVAGEPGGRDRGPSGMWWAAVGLLAGAGGGLLYGRAVARRAAGPARDEPRRGPAAG